MYVHTRRPEGPLVTGLGLGAFMLFLFGRPASGTELVLRAAAGPATLLGRTGFFAGAGAFGTGAGRSIIVMAEGRTNIPRPISHSKYRSP